MDIEYFNGVLTLEKTILKQTLMPGPCSVFQSVNNFGNRFYRKEKSTAWPFSLFDRIWYQSC